MTSAGAGFFFSIVVRIAWAEVQILELRHVKPLASVPNGFLADVMEDYNCWGGDLAEVVIHANHPRDEPNKDIIVATCRAACLSNIGCQAWSLNHGSHGARGSGHCWLKHSCENGDTDPYSVSGLVDHKDLMQHVQAPDFVDPTDLIGVLEDTNCWGRDIVEVAINGSGNTTRDELLIACKDACVADQACAAWTLNHGRTGGHCWLKSSCAGRMYDTRAEAGIVNHNPSNTAYTVTSNPSNTADTVTSNPSNTASRQRDSNGGNPTGDSTTKSSSANGNRQGNARSNTNSGPDSIAGSTTSVVYSSSLEGGHTNSNPGHGTDSNSGSGNTTTKPAEMRLLENGDPAATQPQPPSLRGGDNPPGLSEKDKGIIGGVVGAGTGALALGLLAGLVHPTSPPNRGLIQSSTIAAVGVNDAGAKSGTDVVSVAGVANDTDDTNHTKEEEENPVKQWWGWVFLIPLFLMAALCCFAIFMFKGTRSMRKTNRSYSKVGSDTSIDTSEGMLSGSPSSPGSPVQRFPRNELFKSPSPAPRAFVRSPLHSETRDISVTMAPVQLRQLSSLPMSQVVMVPVSPRQLSSQPPQQQQQQQLSFTTSPRQSQVQGQQSPPSQYVGGTNSLFDALDQNQDGVITRSEFNRAFGVSPVLVDPASTPVVSAVIAADPRAVGNPTMMLTSPGLPPMTPMSPMTPMTPQVGTSMRPSPSRGLSQSASSVQAVMGSPVLFPGTASPMAGRRGPPL